MRRKAFWAVLGIAAAAFLIRWSWAVAPRMVRWDEPDHLILARNLARGAGYHVNVGAADLTIPPLIPVLGALAFRAGVEVQHVSLIWHLLAGALLCGLLYGLARDVTGSRRAAALAAVLAAASPALAVWPLYWGSMTESLFIALVLGGLWAGWRLLHGGGLASGVVMGGCFGLSYLVRPEGLVWYTLFAGLASLLALRRRSGFAALAISALAFVLVAAPYWAYLYQNTGRFMLSGKTGITVALGLGWTPERGVSGNDLSAALDSAGEEIMWLSPQRFSFGLMDPLRDNPRWMLGQLARNLRDIPPAIAGPLLGVAGVILAALGLFGKPWDRRRLAGNGFLLLALVPLAVVPLFWVHPRLIVPLVPIALIWVAQGVLHLAEWGRATLRGAPLLARLWGPAVAAGVVLLALAGQAPAALEGRAGQVPSLEAAGRWLAANAAPGAPVMARNSELAVYADRPLVAFPDAEWADVVAYGAARGARYLVVDDWELQKMRPQLAMLGDSRTLPPELALAAAFADGRRTTRVFSFSP